MKCQILFSRKNKKKYFKMLSAKMFTQHATCYIFPRKHMLWDLNKLHQQDHTEYPLHIFYRKKKKETNSHPDTRLTCTTDKAAIVQAGVYAACSNTVKYFNATKCSIFNKIPVAVFTHSKWTV